MDLGLTNQVAVVVGGANGIGRAIAETFAAEGCRVAVLDIHPDVAKTAEAIQQQHGVEALGLHVDATQFSETQKAFENVKVTFGSVQHVVYAAGCGSNKFGFPFWNMTPEDWPRVINVNLIGAVNTAHAVQPFLCDEQEGTMLFISSVAGQIGSQTDPPYSAAKAALINFAQCAAKDFAPYNVRVNVLCPGMVQTDLNRSVYQAWADRQPEGEKMTYETWAGQKIKSIVPLGRWQDANDIAGMTVFLASPRCKNVTGQTVNVDGGFVMHW